MGTQERFRAKIAKKREDRKALAAEAKRSNLKISRDSSV
jgi:hypothetical protein